MSDPDEMLARRAGEVESEGKRAHGEENWQRAMRGVEQQLKNGAIDQTDLLRKLGKADAAGSLFNDGIANASEADWRAWRDAQPHSKARIDRLHFAEIGTKMGISRQKATDLVYGAYAEMAPTATLDKVRREEEQQNNKRTLNVAGNLNVAWKIRGVTPTAGVPGDRIRRQKLHLLIWKPHPRILLPHRRKHSACSTLANR